MKLIHKETINGKTILTVEVAPATTPRFFFQKPKPQVTVKYEASRLICAGYWAWLELPDRILVPDGLSFQLDEWVRA